MGHCEHYGRYAHLLLASPARVTEAARSNGPHAPGLGTMVCPNPLLLVGSDEK
jgi:hypothetical protein